jgi:hypothetical protein
MRAHLGDQIGKASEAEQSQRRVDGLDDGLEQLNGVAAVFTHRPARNGQRKRISDAALEASVATFTKKTMYLVGCQGT